MQMQVLREKYPDNISIIKTEMPVPVIKKSMASAGIIAYVIQQKYQMGTPLYRQEQYCKAQGIDLNRTTMANWIIRSSQWICSIILYVPFFINPVISNAMERVDISFFCTFCGNDEAACHN